MATRMGSLFAALCVLLAVNQAAALDSICSNPCFTNLPASCGGECPFALYEVASVAYQTTNSSQMLCTNACQAALYSDSVAQCMKTNNLVNETAAVEKVRTATCPTLCFLQAAPLKDFYAACGSLLNLLNTNAVVQPSSCTDTCKAKVETIPISCRSSVAVSQASDAAQKAKGVFDVCKVPYMLNGVLMNGAAPAAGNSSVTNAAPSAAPFKIMGALVGGAFAALYVL